MHKELIITQGDVRAYNGGFETSFADWQYNYTFTVHNLLLTNESVTGLNPRIDRGDAMALVHYHFARNAPRKLAETVDCYLLEYTPEERQFVSGTLLDVTRWCDALNIDRKERARTWRFALANAFFAAAPIRDLTKLR